MRPRLLALLLCAPQSRAACVFEGAVLRNSTGGLVGGADLAERSVAIYSAGEWCPLCTRFTPALRAFHERYQEVSIVFVSSDATADEAEEHYRHQLAGRTPGPGWLSLAFDDPLAATLKRRHRVWSGVEAGTFGFGRRSGVPCVVVIDESGTEIAFLQGERHGAAALNEWEPEAMQSATWPPRMTDEL